MDDLLMLSGVELDCPDCDGPRLFVPTEDGADGTAAGSWCCTDCDAAVFVLDVAVGVTSRGSRARSRVA